MKTPTKRRFRPRIAIRGSKSLVVKHQSLAHDKLRDKASQLKAQEVEKAVKWCILGHLEGWKGLKNVKSQILGQNLTFKYPKMKNRAKYQKFKKQVLFVFLKASWLQKMK